MRKNPGTAWKYSRFVPLGCVSPMFHPGTRHPECYPAYGSRHLWLLSVIRARSFHTVKMSTTAWVQCLSVAGYKELWKVRGFHRSVLDTQENEVSTCCSVKNNERFFRWFIVNRDPYSFLFFFFLFSFFSFFFFPSN